MRKTERRSNGVPKQWRIAELGTWNLELGTWNLELGTWNLELGTWNLELGTWNLELGTWNLELGTWNLELFSTCWPEMFHGKKIVVVMPAYNAEKTVTQTVDEVLQQGVVDEIILVDDRSRDDTVQVASQLLGVKV